MQQQFPDLCNFELCESSYRMNSNLDRIVSNSLSYNQSDPSSINKFARLQSNWSILPDSYSNSYLTPKINELFIKFQELSKSVDKFCNIIDQCKAIANKPAQQVTQRNLQQQYQQVKFPKRCMVKENQRLKQNISNKIKQVHKQYKNLGMQVRNSNTQKNQNQKQISQKGYFFKKYQQVLKKYNAKLISKFKGSTIGK